MPSAHLTAHTNARIPCLCDALAQPLGPNRLGRSQSLHIGTSTPTVRTLISTKEKKLDTGDKQGGRCEKAVKNALEAELVADSGGDVQDDPVIDPARGPYGRAI